MKHMVCQSCGMPISVVERFGTNEDGSENRDYCIFCYQNGKFTRECSMEEFIESVLVFSDQAGMAPEEMRSNCEVIFPTLKRWKK